jgi:hypothetical protein
MQLSNDFLFEPNDFPLHEFSFSIEFPPNFPTQFSTAIPSKLAVDFCSFSLFDFLEFSIVKCSE